MTDTDRQRMEEELRRVNKQSEESLPIKVGRG
jgi:hypothetical protein